MDSGPILDKLRGTAEQSLKVSTGAQCNLHQCQGLSMLLHSLLSYITFWTLFFGPLIRSKTNTNLFRDLLKSVKSVKRLVDSYTSNSWHDAALFSMENSLVFQSLADEIARYVEMVNRRILSSVVDDNRIRVLIDKVKADKDVLDQFLQEAAKRDRAHLQRRAGNFSFMTTKARREKLAWKMKTRDSVSVFKIDMKDLHVTRRSLGEKNVVFLASWMGLPVAAKRFAQDGDFRYKIEVEIMRGFQASHPNIVQALGVAEDEHNKYLVMELMDMNLKEFRARQRRISPSEKVDIMLQIASGLAFLHRNNVCYRDLKPENVLIKVEPPDRVRVKLADFGHSKNDFRSRTPNTMLMGTPGFMAPEVMKFGNDEGLYTKKSDVFSFSLVCSETWTGERTFQNQEMAEIRRRLERDERPRLEDCPPKLRRLLERCWAFEARDRPEVGEIVRELWEIKYELLTGASVDQQQPPEISSRRTSTGVDEEVAMAENDRFSSPETSSSSTGTSFFSSSLACVSDLTISGAAEVDSRLTARWRYNGSFRSCRVQWGRSSTPSCEGADWNVFPAVPTISTENELLLTLDDHDSYICVRVKPGDSSQVGEPADFCMTNKVTLEDDMEQKLSSLVAEKYAKFTVTIDGHPYARFILEQRYYKLHWDREHPRNFTGDYERSSIEAPRENPKLCRVESSDRTYQLKFESRRKRDLAYLTMKRLSKLLS